MSAKRQTKQCRLALVPNNAPVMSDRSRITLKTRLYFMAKTKSKFYAVAKGKHSDSPGIYTTWLETYDHVNEAPGARHHSFPTRNEAERWLEANRERVSSALPAGAATHNASTMRTNAAPVAVAPPILSSRSSSAAAAPEREQREELGSYDWSICVTKSVEEVSVSEHIQYFYRDVAIPLGNIPDGPIDAHDVRPPPKRFFDTEDEESDNDEDILLFQSASVDHVQWEEEEFIPFSQSPPATPTNRRRKKRKPIKFYAVPVGHLPGVYLSWDAAEVQLKGYTDSRCKSEKDEGLAWMWYFNRYRRPRDYSDDKDVVGGVTIEQAELEPGPVGLLEDTASPQRTASQFSSRSNSPQLVPASSSATTSPGHYYGQPSPPIECARGPEVDAASHKDDFCHDSEDEFADADAEWLDDLTQEQLDRLELQLSPSRTTGSSDDAASCTSGNEFADAAADSDWMDCLTDDELGWVDSHDQSSCSNGKGRLEF